MATAEYDKENTWRISLKFNSNTDKDVIGKLQSVENMQGYIKSLIRKDLESEYRASHNVLFPYSDHFRSNRRR